MSKSLTKKMLEDVMPEEEKEKKKGYGKGGSDFWDDDWRGGYDDLYGSSLGTPSYMDAWDRSRGYTPPSSGRSTYSKRIEWDEPTDENEAKKIIKENSGGVSGTIKLDAHDSNRLVEEFRAILEEEFEDAGLVLTQDATEELKASLLSILDLCKWRDGVSLFDLRLR